MTDETDAERSETSTYNCTCPSHNNIIIVYLKLLEHKQLNTKFIPDRKVPERNKQLRRLIMKKQGK